MHTDVRLSFIASLIFPCLSFAQPAEPASWVELRRKNPSAPVIRLALESPGPYHEGQPIPVKATSVRTAPLPASQELWSFAGIVFAPAAQDGCGSTEKPCFPSMPLGFEKWDPTMHIGYSDVDVKLTLNRYLPRLHQGSYSAAVLLRKQVLKGNSPVGRTYGYAEPGQYSLSNSVHFEVLPATGKFIQDTVRASSEELSRPMGQDGGVYERRRAAAEALRYLDVPASWQASLAALPAEEFTLLGGLAETREARAVCDRMQAVVDDPSQAASSLYLRALAYVCGRVELPPAPVSTTPNVVTAEQQAWEQRRFEYDRAHRAKTAARLASALGRKQQAAKLVALQTLLEYLRQLRSDRPTEPMSVWASTVRTEFIKAYPQAPRAQQPMLLGLFASTFRSPDLIPFLESVMASWKPGDYYEASREALQHLYAIDPARARARIAAEVVKEKTWLDSPQLELLPAAEARISDEALIDALAVAQRSGGWNVQLRMSAIAKYASARALPKIRAIFESQQQPCQPELMAYLVRVDPAYADSVFRRVPWDMHAEPPPCTEAYFSRTAPLSMAPALERYMAAFLMHSQVPVKAAAARSLMIYGSSGAQGPLREAFQYFHDFWKDRRGELAQNPEAPHLEMTLRNAVARGMGWFVGESDLRTLEALCLTALCRAQSGQDLETWRQRPLRIWVADQAGSFMASVVHYQGIRSVEALERKLAQFPRGTQFVMTVDEAATGERIRRYAAEHGLGIVSGR